MLGNILYAQITMSGVRPLLWHAFGPNVRYRIAAAALWHLSVTICWDRTVVSRGEMEAVCLDTGRLVGIGDGRAIGYGRFSIAQFTIAEMPPLVS